MGTKRPSVAALCIVVILGAISLTGCFGYNRSAKRWSYVGDTVLILGGGGAIAADLLTKTDEPPCMGRACPYESPFSGTLLVGAMLVTAGIVGIIVNATRPIVKSSR